MVNNGESRIGEQERIPEGGRGKIESLKAKTAATLGGLMLLTQVAIAGDGDFEPARFIQPSEMSGMPHKELIERPDGYKYHVAHDPEGNLVYSVVAKGPGEPQSFRYTMANGDILLLDFVEEGPCAGKKGIKKRKCLLEQETISLEQRNAGLEQRNAGLEQRNATLMDRLEELRRERRKSEEKGRQLDATKLDLLRQLEELLEGRG